MNIYEKLMKARIELQARDLKKSGLNKFAGYSYFELADFIPATLSIFNDLGLCGVVSYAGDMAQLIIINIDKPEESIVITSPMSTAALKGCHPIQNLGAVETYQRRYLWVTAMEILEHDALDSSEAVKEEKKVQVITTDQAILINDLLRDTKSEAALKSFLANLGTGIYKVDDIPARMYAKAKKMLDDKKAKMEEGDIPQ